MYGILWEIQNYDRLSVWCLINGKWSIHSY